MVDKVCMLKHTIFSLLACGLVMATESFDSLPAGQLTGGETLYGKLSAAAGHAEILKGKAKSGPASLHIMGGKDKSVTITLEKPLAKETPCDFWAERWTSRAPFEFAFIAVTPEGENRIEDGHYAFYTDEEKLDALCVELFYRPKK